MVKYEESVGWQQLPDGPQDPQLVGIRAPAEGLHADRGVGRRNGPACPAEQVGLAQPQRYLGIGRGLSGPAQSVA